MKTISLLVEGMSCAHCEKAVKQAVSAISGVQKVEILLKRKTVTIQCDDSAAESDLVSAIEDAGYDVRV